MILFHDNIMLTINILGILFFVNYIFDIKDVKVNYYDDNFKNWNADIVPYIIFLTFQKILYGQSLNFLSCEINYNQNNKIKTENVKYINF